MPTLYYLDKGAGFPVVFIHGFCETSEVWNSVIDRLSSTYRTIAIDLPGFGRSNTMPPPDSIEQAAEHAINFLNGELKLTECVVLGHSMGGYVGLAMLEKDPDLFRGFGLIHSTAYADSDERKASRNKVIEFVSKHGVKPFIESFIPPLFFDPSDPSIPWAVELAAKTKKSVLIGWTRAMRDREDRIHVLKNFNKPVLFLAGKSDSVIPVDSISSLAAMTKDANLSIMEDVAHMGMLEKEEKTSEVIAGFLAGFVPKE